MYARSDRLMYTAARVAPRTLVGFAHPPKARVRFHMDVRFGSSTLVLGRSPGLRPMSMRRGGMPVGGGRSGRGRPPTRLDELPLLVRLDGLPAVGRAPPLRPLPHVNARPRRGPLPRASSMSRTERVRVRALVIGRPVAKRHKRRGRLGGRLVAHLINRDAHPTRFSPLSHVRPRRRTAAGHAR